ncbi:MAG: hypothetical protein JHC26_07270 [Thermofilum sp.]|jgi:hypothetical protein|uniref:hypothetical protein n=1 Tax=Thermofilum sp. TaxID=1961369 RepID=UPI00258887DE|nr:hypothetical protein [Thermofilum sp.]MCI4408877.1 hypothetical protein [Thermofilum sp.]
MPEPKYFDSLEGDWIERRYTGERIVKKFKYIGVFVPSEPFLAVFYDDEKDDLDTEPVYAFVARVVYLSGLLHYVEFLPVIAWLDGGMEALEQGSMSNYVGFVPARLYEESHDELLKMARNKYEARKKAKQK